jgi:hypothetical protein
MRAGQILPIYFQVEPQSLPIGNKMDYMVFQLRDADYSDRRHNSDVVLAFCIVHSSHAQNRTDSFKVLSHLEFAYAPTGTMEIAGSCVDITILTCSVVIFLYS